MKFPLVADDIDLKEDGDRHEVMLSESLKTFLSDFGISEYEIEMMGVSSKSCKIVAFNSESIRPWGYDYSKHNVVELLHPKLVVNHDNDIMVLKLAWEGR